MDCTVVPCKSWFAALPSFQALFLLRILFLFLGLSSSSVFLLFGAFLKSALLAVKTLKHYLSGDVILELNGRNVVVGV
ncbi:hypothetical protein HPP92_024634 [Vanilla planifolia]|uniref:Uncharacterized protein n=1 Tax=Vanilla planifolia TaxID=51239 RepID=A0A835PMR1_VANPL|nr:hypothetical protein HPP92_024634 [Vanilla planifolia]